MLQQDAQTHKDQHDPSCELGLGFEFGTEEMAYVYANRREGEGNDAYKADRRDNGDVQKGEGNADGQSIYTGGNRHGEHGPRGEGAIAGLCLTEGFLDHVGTDKAQQDKGDPVVNAFDVAAEPKA